MPQRASSSSSLMRPFVVLALPGMYLLYKYNQYRQQQMETTRRRVTERELMHLNTKISTDDEDRLISGLLNKGKDINFVRFYAKKENETDCRRALTDIPPEGDTVCTEPCERRKEKKGILHRIKLRVIEGGTNFGTPFRQLRGAEAAKEEPPAAAPAPRALPPPERKAVALLPPRAGVQVSVLGAETPVGQYLAFLLKQCQSIKKLRLYAAKATDPQCCRDLCQVVEDLRHIDTNCCVQAFSCACNELGRCLQNSDLVLMLDDAYPGDSLEKRFCDQAPKVKCYADTIANECPKAFVIVATTPVDCMVPLTAQALKDMGWYNPRKLLGSLAVPEMRASTLAARALCLDPSYTKVPCIGGAEGDALVPLFSKAVEYFDFPRHNALMLTETVRAAAAAVARGDGECVRAAELSEAHALAGLVSKIANALVCKDIPRLTGFVQTYCGQMVCSSRFLANVVEIDGAGISRNFSLPKISDTETDLMYMAFSDLCYKHCLMADWYLKYCSSSCGLNATQLNFFTPRHYDRFDDCAYANM